VTSISQKSQRNGIDTQQWFSKHFFLISNHHPQNHQVFSFYQFFEVFFYDRTLSFLKSPVLYRFFDSGFFFPKTHNQQLSDSEYSQT